jgi:dephospho-CoA kinase
MTKVGLTGGLATGKSFVGHVLEELGCHVMRADKVGHAVLMPDGEAYGRVVAEFGGEILLPDGHIDRKRLAGIVFGQPGKLEALNAIVHPAVIRREEEFMAGIAASEPDGIAVVEAAILIETGSYRRFDRILLVVCTEEQQMERAMHRDGWTREEAMARLKRQMPLAEKRKFADFVIDTSGSKENTVEQTRHVYNALRSRTT